MNIYTSCKRLIIEADVSKRDSNSWQPQIVIFKISDFLSGVYIFWRLYQQGFVAI